MFDAQLELNKGYGIQFIERETRNYQWCFG